MFVEVYYLAHTGVVQTEVIADFLQRIPAAGAGRSDEDVPIAALQREVSERLRDGSGPGLRRIAQIASGISVAVC